MRREWYWRLMDFPSISESISPSLSSPSPSFTLPLPPSLPRSPLSEIYFINEDAIPTKYMYIVHVCVYIDFQCACLLQAGSTDSTVSSKFFLAHISGSMFKRELYTMYMYYMYCMYITCTCIVCTCTCITCIACILHVHVLYVHVHVYCMYYVHVACVCCSYNFVCYFIK